MEFPDQDLEEILIGNSFVLFLITISKLGLSKEASDVLRYPRVYALVKSTTRLRTLRSKGILIL